MIRCAMVSRLVGVLAVTAFAADIPPNMTTYYFGVLMKGPKWSAEAPPERAAIQEGHMAQTLEEAQRLASDNPAVKAGRLGVTLHPWLVERGILPDPLEGAPSAAEPK